MLILLAQIPLCAPGALFHDTPIRVETGAVPIHTEHAPARTEIMLATARRGEPCELRLRESGSHRFPRTTRGELARVIRERRSNEVTIRHGSLTPQRELDAWTQFLREAGVESIVRRRGPRVPFNPAPTLRKVP